MKRALFAVLILFAASSKAELMTSDGRGNSITLHDEQCVAAPWLAEWKTGTLVWQGKVYAMCWKKQLDLENRPTVFTIDSDGEVANYPASMFRPATKV